MRSFIICTPQHILLTLSNEEREMDGHSVFKGLEKYEGLICLIGNLDGVDHLKNLNIERMILKWILKKLNGGV
jgi:hypothetical protein